MIICNARKEHNDILIVTTGWEDGFQCETGCIIIQPEEIESLIEKLGKEKSKVLEWEKESRGFHSCWQKTKRLENDYE